MINFLLSRSLLFFSGRKLRINVHVANNVSALLTVSKICHHQHQRRLRQGGGKERGLMMVLILDRMRGGGQGE